MKWMRDVLIGVCLTMLLTYFMRDLAIHGLPMFHDSNPHIARAIAYHTALIDGQLPPMWAKELLGGIGSPVLMLNYQLPYMLGELWHRLGASIFDSYKLTLGITYIASGAFMYTALRTKFGRKAAWVGAIIYSLAPYRFVDIYVRGALGEAMAFMFPPLLIMGWTKMSLPILIVGWMGLFLTHPTASALFSAFFLGYCVFVGKRDLIKPKLNLFASSFGIALMIAAFNILPTLALTKFTYYSPALSDTFLMFPSLSQLIHFPWGYGVSLPGPNDGMSFELGLVLWLVLLGGTIWARKTKDKELIYVSVTTWLMILLILPISIPIYKIFGLSQFIDFPWRLLLCVVFGCAWIGAILVEKLKVIKIIKLLVIGITVTMVVQAIPIAHTNKYWDVHKTEKFFSRETGDSYGEYAPLTRATRDSSPFWKRIEFVSGSGEIETQIEKSNLQKYLIRTNEIGEVRINTAYFPGWTIPSNCMVTERTLTHIDDSGLIGCTVAKGEQILEIKYEATPVQKIGNLLTLAGIGVFIWISFQSFYQRLMKKTR
ncbi:MAG: hypothetical protein ABII21_01805 [bacterium]